jgi:hypothetical protein
MTSAYVIEHAIREMSDEELDRSIREDAMPLDLLYAMQYEQARRLDESGEVVDG